MKNLNFIEKRMKNRKFVLKHISIGIQKESEEMVVKKKSDFDGMEFYLYISCSCGVEKIMQRKITMENLEEIGLTEMEAWKKSGENLQKHTIIKNITDVLSDVCGNEPDSRTFCEQMELEDNGIELSIPMYVISSDSGLWGAGAIYNKEMLERFAELHNVKKLVIIPSSIHEMILVPSPDFFDEEEWNQMVFEINRSDVPESDRLTDQVYVMKF